MTFNYIISEPDPFLPPSAASIDVYIDHFKAALPSSLTTVIEKNHSLGNCTKLLVYDSVMPWCLGTARELGLEGAPFITLSCTFTTIFNHVFEGKLKVPLQEPTVLLPGTGIPRLGLHDMPSFISNPTLHASLLKILVEQISNFQQLKWIFCNSFDKLEEEVVNWITSQWPFKNVGPTIPSMYLDKRMNNDKDYGLSLFQPNSESCMKWLDSKEIGSVIYISFGSLATLVEEQMEEITLALKKSNYYFLWVVRESEINKLPQNFVQDTATKGLLVNWCPQLEVLNHKAVACFMTHCGWNSTLEALSLAVPMVAMPQWTDQPTNAKFIVDVWKVGIRARIDHEKGIVTREEIEMCIREVMEGERGNEMRRISLKWKKLAKEAVDDDGSSDKNIEKFVAQLISS
ncbi:Glycosyltransferase [Quillaja saponaria]|uniref:Glycosyltransferase n=1 Tax=Quillaja saponaria TaxID=32244 RepID=A0AAD7LPH0_QUISA|nr:Glycosyltransferase [Quillaja saponaria]